MGRCIRSARKGRGRALFQASVRPRLNCAAHRILEVLDALCFVDKSYFPIIEADTEYARLGLIAQNFHSGWPRRWLPFILGDVFAKML